MDDMIFFVLHNSTFRMKLHDYWKSIFNPTHIVGASKHRHAKITNGSD